MCGYGLEKQEESRFSQKRRGIVRKWVRETRREDGKEEKGINLFRFRSIEAGSGREKGNSKKDKVLTKMEYRFTKTPASEARKTEGK